jgi:hypothetical protein
MPYGILDVLHASEAQRRPVFVDRDLPHRIEAAIANHIPAGVSIELAGVALRGSLGIGEPQQGIACGTGAQDSRQPIELALLRCESQCELYPTGFFGFRSILISTNCASCGSKDAGTLNTTISFCALRLSF